MPFAVFADVHANLYALDAVLSDLGARGVETVYCAGDLVGYGPHPNEVIQLLRQRGIPAVMGNYDDAIANQRLVCGCDYKDPRDLALAQASLSWTSLHTGPENKAWLRGLPPEIRFTVHGRRILIVHGSPRRLNEYLYEDTPEEALNELLEQYAADILVCGHTHRPYRREVSRGLVINAGSVGRPKHGNPNAVYALVTADSEDVGVEFAEVLYPYEKTARAIEEAGLPPDFADEVRTGGRE